MNLNSNNKIMNTLNHSRNVAALPRAGCLPAPFPLAGLLATTATAQTFNLLKGFDTTGDSPQAPLIQEMDTGCFGLGCSPTASVRDAIYPKNNLRFDPGNLALFDGRQAPGRCSA
jgi:hypothetical protein